MNSWVTVFKQGFLYSRFVPYLTAAWLVGGAALTLGFWPELPYPFQSWPGLGWRTLSVFVVTMGFGVWGAIRVSLDTQLSPATIQLVPGLRRAALIVTLAAWPVMAGALALETCIFGVPFPWAFAALLAVLAVTVARRPILRRTSSVLLFSVWAPMYGYRFSLPDGPNAMGMAWMTVLLSLAIGTMIIKAQLGKGAETYTVLHGRLVHVALRHPTSTQPDVGAWDGVLKRPKIFRWWFEDVLRTRSPELRMIHGMGTAFHWSQAVGGVFLQSGVTFALMFILSRFVRTEGTGSAYSLEGVVNFSAIGASIYAVLMGDGRLRTLSLRRKEQALLLLLPSAPTGRDVNRWLIQVLVFQHALAITVGIWIVALLAFALQQPLDSTLKVAAAPTAVSLLFTPLFVRDYARMPPSRPLKYVAPSLVAIFVGQFAAALLGGSIDPLVLILSALVLSGLIAGWRYARLADAPTAFPVGRLAA
jgi:hypothetical protein